MRVPENFRLLYGAEQIRECVKRVGREVSGWAEQVRAETGEDLLAIPVLRGSIIFAADLVREIEQPIKMVPVRAWAYEVDEEPLDGVRLHLDDLDVRGASVLLIDDICDSGRTLAALAAEFQRSGAREVKAAVLVKRELESQGAFTPDFVGLRYPKTDWLVGYGMDSSDRWRSLPAIYTIVK